MKKISDLKSKKKKKKLPGVNLHITGFEFKKSGLHCH